MTRKLLTARAERQKRTRAKISGTAARPRLSVFRSHSHIWAQLIDDERGRTLAAESDTSEKLKSKNEKAGKSPILQREPRAEREGAMIKMKKTERALTVGKALAEKALAIGVKKVIFDRGSYKYHGRVKALAEGAREGGLAF